eukprot:g8328.t1
MLHRVHDYHEESGQTLAMMVRDPDNKTPIPIGRLVAQEFTALKREEMDQRPARARRSHFRAMATGKGQDLSATLFVHMGPARDGLR